jgi:hypothetical protein
LFFWVYLFGCFFGGLIVFLGLFVWLFLWWIDCFFGFICLVVFFWWIDCFLLEFVQS